MPKVIKLKRGLDIRLAGAAEKCIRIVPESGLCGIMCADYLNVAFRLLVREGDEVRAGSPLLFDKARPEILFCSPVSGVVSAINRGEKRKLLSVAVEAGREQSYIEFEVPQNPDRESVTKLLLESGLWPAIIRRPYGIVADPGETPRAIFISGFDSAPLAPDIGYLLEGEEEAFEAGLTVLKHLTEGRIHISVRNGEEGFFAGIEGAEMHRFEGRHPAGNVGVQIHHIDPINRGEVVWTVAPHNVAIIGRLFTRGVVDMRRRVAVAGSEAAGPCYVETVSGTAVNRIVRPADIRRREDGSRVRVISGNVLSGRMADYGRDFLGFHDNMITLIPEGDKYEFLGWAMPRLNKFSASRAYFSWLMPRHRYALDTNLNGGERPFILSGLYERCLPMDIHPVYLLKAALAEDMERMEALGIYEVTEEDMALCEFVDPSKIEMQKILRDGIDLMIKELG